MFLNYVGSEESTNPFDWWKLQLEEDKDRLKDLSLTSYRTLTLQVGSTFSESQFSHSKIITSGCSAKTGVNTLNARQFIRFNAPIVEEEFEKPIRTLHSSQEHYSSLVKNLDVQFREQVILAEEMDDETFEVEELENCDVHSLSRSQSMKNMCGNPLCLEYSMKVFNTKNFKNAITCDNPSCFKSGEQLKSNEIFYGCTKCKEYDVCKLCYDLLC